MKKKTLELLSFTLLSQSGMVEKQTIFKKALIENEVKGKKRSLPYSIINKIKTDYFFRDLFLKDPQKALCPYESKLSLTEYRSLFEQDQELLLTSSYPFLSNCDGGCHGY